VHTEAVYAALLALLTGCSFSCLQIPAEAWPALEAQLTGVLSGSSRSSRPAIHGMTVADESIQEVAVGNEVRLAGLAFRCVGAAPNFANTYILAQPASSTCCSTFAPLASKT